MATLHQKITALLRARLTDFADALEDLPGGRVSGVVISSTFNAINHQSRQKRLTAILKQGLNEDELAALGAIAALTPAEAQVKASEECDETVLAAVSDHN